MYYLTKHLAAVALGKRRAKEEGEHVMPKISKAKAAAAAEKLGTYSHINDNKKKKKK